MSRSAILQAAAHGAPELLAYVHWAYGQPSRLWVVGSVKHPVAKGCTDDGTLAIVPIYIPNLD
jgi:hypothetical protein